MTDNTDHLETLECGRLLKRTRERLGLSLDDVASELRLSSFQVQALEDDDWERLPGTTYARGYLRSYARLLDLDADKLLEGATTQELNIPPAQSPPDAQEAEEPDGAVRWSGGSIRAWAGAFAVVVLLAGYLWQSDEASQLVTDIADEATGEQDETSNDAPSSSPVEQSDTGTETTEAQVAEAGEGSTDQTPLPEGWSRIVFQFDQSSWVDLRDARGERLLYRSFQPGRRIEVEGKPPFRVFLGNARAVQIEYSGKSITPDTRSERLYARFMLGAPSG